MNGSTQERTSFLFCWAFVRETRVVKKQIAILFHMQIRSYGIFFISVYEIGEYQDF
jgi:hypothetical protein